MNRFDFHDPDTFRDESDTPLLTEAEQDEKNLCETIDRLCAVETDDAE